MGLHGVRSELSPERLRSFTKNLLDDIRALEFMLDQKMLESDVVRIGAEQEMFIVDGSCAARKAMEILERLDDPHFTTELATFNLEFNIDPLPVKEDTLSLLEQRINGMLGKVQRAAKATGSEILLIGILPTLKRSDIGSDSMTPKPRYFALNEALTVLRGREYELFLRGIDELYIRHDSLMLEACNTSFQVHFQVNPDEFARYYNIAQAIAGPVLAASSYSPLLFGKRLWHETRIAVFQQATDTRQPDPHLRESFSRVHFGNAWVKESVLEIFQEDITRFRVLMGIDVEEDPFEVLKRGEVPQLKALQLHNGTIYRWNRPCYGLTAGKPHLRIENRILPSGPTVLDEVANAAFWLGLIKGIANQCEDISALLDFDDVRSNFNMAARRGLLAQFTWVGKQIVPAATLIQENLLAVARSGLIALGIRMEDVDRYLGVIEKRVSARQTGSDWLLRSHAAVRAVISSSKSAGFLTAAALENQGSGAPVHEWPIPEAGTIRDMRDHHRLVEQFMTTDLLTVNEDDPVDLVLSIMHWRRVRHLPVEDNNHRLRGLVDYRSLIKLFVERGRRNETPVPVRDIMQTDVPTIQPTTTTLQAIELMCRKGATCLPVVQDGCLVGIITQNDIVHIAAQFLEGGLGVTEMRIAPAENVSQ